MLKPDRRWWQSPSDAAVPFGERIMWGAFIIGVMWAGALTRKGGVDALAGIICAVVTLLVTAVLVTGIYADRPSRWPEKNDG